jgi:formylglycine-generating enzyme required for sulfatase activity
VAQGDDKRTYPWGNQPPTSDLCNFANTIGQTTPVTWYPKGASPYGVMDMSGNVLEWCLTEWGTSREMLDGTNIRALRGGSWWGSFTGLLRASFRLWGDADIGVEIRGFQLARSSAPEPQAPG